MAVRLPTFPAFPVPPVLVSVVAVATLAVMAAPSASASIPSTASNRACASGALTGTPLSSPSTVTGTQAASYSNRPGVPQAQSCAGMRTFISTPQPGFDLQSYVFYGHLRDTSGKVVAFSMLTQRQKVGAGDGPTADLQVAATTVNDGTGTTVGGLEAPPGAGVAVSATSNPWSMRTEATTAGATPQYLDARVVSGQLGQPGAVIELTAQVQSETIAAPSAPPEPLQVSVRLVDVAGVGQWGYGPSGFFPQWIHPDQRAAITGRFKGSVADYLAATGDPMRDQGSYYYSSPVLHVSSFTISRGGSVVAHGTDGELLADYVTQSFDASAQAVVDNGVQWLEFSTLLDGDRTMKVGVVHQASVGSLPYAMLLAKGGSHLANGSLAASRRWNMDDVRVDADPSASWTSPRSGKHYSTRYQVRLAGSDGASSASLTYRALYDDQELTVAGRTVYEGLFVVRGTLGGKPVSGYAWAEIQPSGTL